MSEQAEGPYVEMDGPRVWVPRTVPYRRAASVARDAVQEWDQYPKYVGKEDALLLGFVRDCQCEEVCCGGPVTDDGSCTPDPACYVPAWKFEIVERSRP